MGGVNPPTDARAPRDHLEPAEIHAFVCHWGKTCPAKGSQELVGHLRDKLAARGLQHKVRVTKSGCLSLCDIGPNLVIYPGGVWYSGVQARDLDEILQSHILQGKPVGRLLTPRKAGAG